MTRDMEWLNSLRGRFVVFEGPDGSGKTTQFRRLAAVCREHDLPLCEVREPGGTPVGEEIRRILRAHDHNEMTPHCEMLLYMASRAQLVEQRIRPALARGELVLADRFVASTFAYQGAALGVPREEIEAVARIATRGCLPDLVLVFDVDEETSGRRLNPLWERVEARGREFHRRVRRGYLDLIAREPQRHRRIDATVSEEEVWAAVLAVLRQFARTC